MAIQQLQDHLLVPRSSPSWSCTQHQSALALGTEPPGRWPTEACHALSYPVGPRFRLNFYHMGVRTRQLLPPSLTSLEVSASGLHLPGLRVEAWSCLQAE